MPSASGKHATLARFMPKGLTARLTLTVVLTNVVVLISALVFAALAIRAFVPTLHEYRAYAALDQISLGMHDQAAAIGLSLTPFQASARMREAGISGTMPDDLAETLDEYARQIDALAVVFADETGEPLYAYGDPDAVSVVRSALSGAPSSWESGTLRIRGVTAVVAASPVVGTGALPPVGSIAVARPFEPAELNLQGSLELGHPEIATLPSSRPHRLQSASFDDVSMSSTANGFALEAEIPGVDGRAVATIEYEEEVTPLPDDASLLGMALVGLLGALVFGAATGLVIARTISRPIVEAAKQAAVYGADAREGRVAEYAPGDALLPREFAALQDSLVRAFADLAEHHTALTQARAEIEAANTTLEVAVHDSFEGKLVVTDGVITLVNPAAATHLALESIPHDVTALEVLSSAGIESATGDAIDAEALLDSSIARPQVVRVSAEGRSPRWVEIRSLPHDTDPHMLLVTTRDITEQRRLDDLRNEILGLVTHDLRAPLTVITGYLDLLAQRAEEPTMAKAVASAQQSALRMRELLEDLLSATRAEEMFAPTEFVRVPLRELAEEVLVSFQHTSPHTLRLSAECDAFVLGEEKRLRQVLVNLVTNAMKYSPANTEIDIGIVCDERSAVLTVEDRGPGVPYADRERVFERFVRVDSEDSALNPGVGLGLYIVKAIVESHGGTVRVEGRKDGPGACFVVALPLAPATEERR